MSSARQYIPTWDSEYGQRYNAFLLAESREDSDFKADPALIENVENDGSSR